MIGFAIVTGILSLKIKVFLGKQQTRRRASQLPGAQQVPNTPPSNSNSKRKTDPGDFQGATQNLERRSQVHASVRAAEKSAGSEVAPCETGWVSKGRELSEEAIAGNASSSSPKLQTKVLPFVRAYGQILRPTHVLMPRVTISLASYAAKKPAGVLPNGEEG